MSENKNSAPLTVELAWQVICRELGPWPDSAHCELLRNEERRSWLIDVVPHGPSCAPLVLSIDARGEGEIRIARTISEISLCTSADWDELSAIAAATFGGTLREYGPKSSTFLQLVTRAGELMIGWRTADKIFPWREALFVRMFEPYRKD